MPWTKAGPGRPKGKENKVTTDIKAAILKALESKGGWRYLAKQADANPVAFLGLLGKILPLQVNGAGNVLLIEQLCVVANNEWQAERQKLTAPATIDVTPEASEEAEG